VSLRLGGEGGLERYRVFLVPPARAVPPWAPERHLLRETQRCPSALISGRAPSEQSYATNTGYRASGSRPARRSPLQ
jgi:hypothetical protein